MAMRSHLGRRMGALLHDPPAPSRASMAQRWGGVCLLLVSSACEESGPRIYTARAYSADARCLESYAAIGRVEAGELGASCAPACLLLDDELQVSTVCPPYPAEAALTDAIESADCAVALELLAREALCDAALESDAAAPAEASGDAAAPVETGAD